MNMNNKNQAELDRIPGQPAVGFLSRPLIDSAWISKSNSNLEHMTIR